MNVFLLHQQTHIEIETDKHILCEGMFDVVRDMDYVENVYGGDSSRPTYNTKIHIVTRFVAVRYQHISVHERTPIPEWERKGTDRERGVNY